MGFLALASAFAPNLPAATIDPAVCSSSAEAGFEAPFNQQLQRLTCGPLTATFTNPPTDQPPLFSPLGPGSGTAAAGTSLSPLSVTTSASASGESAASASGQLNAFFEVTGPAAVNGVPITQVPLLLNVTGVAGTFSCVNTCISSEAEAQFELADGSSSVLLCAGFTSTFSATNVGAPCTNVNNAGATFSAINESVLLTPNVEDSIIMSAFASLAGPFVTNESGDIAASVDPILTIDPSFAFANDFQIQFSSGVGSAVPEPSPAALVSVAVGVLSLTRRRRRRI
ncbi:MAG TPA: PEP-CTERM sorting domain-containing protein [Bryobacteraceae bacterium]|nr:PEP-CTERM sorting domain-containing protein [Bryobacteraceae bacterium]